MEVNDYYCVRAAEIEFMILLLWRNLISRYLVPLNVLKQYRSRRHVVGGRIRMQETCRKARVRAPWIGPNRQDRFRTTRWFALKCANCFRFYVAMINHRFQKTIPRESRFDVKCFKI